MKQEFFYIKVNGKVVFQKAMDEYTNLSIDFEYKWLKSVSKETFERFRDTIGEEYWGIDYETQEEMSSNRASCSDGLYSGNLEFDSEDLKIGTKYVEIEI